MNFKYPAFFSIAALISNTAFAELPNIKPGYWHVTTTRHGAEQGKPDQISEMCMDENTMQQMFNTGKEAMGGACSNMEMKKVGNKYLSDSTCDLGAFKISTKSEYEGDFSSSYTFKMSSVMDPPMMGQANTQMSGVARHMGDCPASMKPGDTKVNGGPVINPQEMMKKMPKDFMKNLGGMMKNMPQGQGK